MDGIELEIVWSNLISIVQRAGEGAAAHRLQPDRARSRRPRQRAVRPAGPHGGAGRHRHARPHQFARRSRQALRRGVPDADRRTPGDVLITNDPWLSAGHFFDITVMVPAFHKGKLVGFFGSTIHHTDIGGYGVGAGARDVHEEGLWIPHAQALRARRAEQGAARDHPPQRAHAERSVRRSRRAGVERQARRQAAVRTARPAGLRRHRAAVGRDHRALRSTRRARRSASSSPAPITARASSTCPAATSSR